MNNLTRRKLLIGGAIGVLLLAGLSDYSRASAPTGYDVVTINDFEANQAHYLSGCTIYNDVPDNQINAYCMSTVITQTPANNEPAVDPRPIVFGAFDNSNFEWWPSEHSCILKAVYDMTDYTAYDIECGEAPIFSNGFESN